MPQGDQNKPPGPVFSQNKSPHGYLATGSAYDDAIAAVLENYQVRVATFYAATASAGATWTPQPLPPSPITVKNVVEEKVPEPPRVLAWLDSLSLIPKSIREPYLGDLREDLAEMTRAGASLVRIKWKLAVEGVCLLARGLVRILELLRGLGG